MKPSPNYDGFCENFLINKKEVSSSPSISEESYSSSPKNLPSQAKNKSEAEKTNKKLATPTLLKYKNHVLRALKNRPIPRALTQKNEEKSFTAFQEITM